VKRCLVPLISSPLNVLRDSRDFAVNVATTDGSNDQCTAVNFAEFLKCLDQLSDPHNLLSSWYWKLFRRPGVRKLGYEAITYLILVLGLTLRGTLPPFPKLLRGLLFSKHRDNITSTCLLVGLVVHIIVIIISVVIILYCWNEDFSSPTEVLRVYSKLYQLHLMYSHFQHFYQIYKYFYAQFHWCY
jgi:hypothetical protein